MRPLSPISSMAKCASRYENAPEKYRDTPGYQSRKTPHA